MQIVSGLLTALVYVSCEMQSAQWLLPRFYEVLSTVAYMCGPLGFCTKNGLSVWQGSWALWQALTTASSGARCWILTRLKGCCKVFLFTWPWECLSANSRGPHCVGVYRIDVWWWRSHLSSAGWKCIYDIDLACSPLLLPSFCVSFTVWITWISYTLLKSFEHDCYHHIWSVLKWSGAGDGGLLFPLLPLLFISHCLRMCNCL